MKREPNNPYFYEIKGQMEMENGKVPQAQSSYRRACELSPYSNDMKFGLALALLEDNPDKTAAKEAINLLNNITTKEKNNFQAWTLLAKAYGLKGEMMQANLAAAESLVIIGNLDAAERKLNEAEKLSPSPQLKIKINDLKERIKQERKKDYT